jgi:hypothetical protein
MSTIPEMPSITVDQYSNAYRTGGIAGANNAVEQFKADLNEFDKKHNSNPDLKPPQFPAEIHHYMVFDPAGATALIDQYNKQLADYYTNVTPQQEAAAVKENADNDFWSKLFAGAAEVTAVIVDVGDTVTDVAAEMAKIARPLTAILSVIPVTAPYAAAIGAGLEIFIAVERGLDNIMPSGDEIRDLAKGVTSAMADATDSVVEAGKKSSDPGQGTNAIADSSGLMAAMAAMLASGDLEGVVFAVLSLRAELLTEAVQTKFKAMDENNKRLKTLNDEAAVLQGKVANDSGDEGATTELGKKNAEITQLSNIMQKEQIELNSLMQKLTQTYEMLSNIIKKLGDNMAALVRNIS